MRPKLLSVTTCYIHSIATVETFTEVTAPKSTESPCCGAQHPLRLTKQAWVLRPFAVSKISCSLFAHEILTTATRSPPSSCPRQQSARSPIIQNGKLIGAVTHVLVNDPTTGYGIFIENMLDAAA